MLDLETLRDLVQRNCHISDALFARDYSLCVYLLKMREYFRWEKGYRYGEPLPEKELGEWLTEREALWRQLEGLSFVSVPVGDATFDPFDVEAINEALLPHALVYGAGYGNGAKPHFFLGALEKAERGGAPRILVAGREYARDITAPPAMTQGPTVYVRRESLRRLLWERLEEWQWRKQETPMARAARHYGFERDFDGALDAMTEAEIETLILHERGEFEAGLELGEGWEKALADVARSRTEYVLRAVRDHLADCTITLPHLLSQGADASIHFYFANLSGMRRAIFETLAKGYDAWHAEGDLAPLRNAVERGSRYWRDTAHALLACYSSDGNTERLEAMAKEVGL